LLADEAGIDARERLKLVERIDDGFKLAEEDLHLRREGSLFGTRQSGYYLRMASITDHEMIALARREATRLLDSDPDLTRAENALLAEEYRRVAAKLLAEVLQQGGQVLPQEMS
jgi:ATP-dependent DNA helicase RecG